MAINNQSTAPGDAVVADPDAKISFTFDARSRIQSSIGVEHSSPHIEDVDSPMPAKTDIILEDDLGKVMLTPAGYTIVMQIRRITPDVLDDKYQTALTYLDRVIDDNKRNFNPSLGITGDTPVKTFNQHETTLKEWGGEKFGTDHEKKILGNNRQVSLKYRGGPAVTL